VWFTVLALGIAVNFEPTRIGLVPLLLAREQPVRQLLAYLVGSVAVSLSFGMAAIFTFDRLPFASSSSGGGKAQIALGIVALAVAMTMAVLWMRARKRSEVISPDLVDGGKADKFTKSVRSVLIKGRSPWLAGVIGVGVGLPSVDYVAVLIIIATSGTPRIEQAGALLAFTFIGSLVVIAPLISYAIAPTKTLAVLDRFGTWVRARSRIEYAGFLGLIGLLFIGLGWSHL